MSVLSLRGRGGTRSKAFVEGEYVPTRITEVELREPLSAVGSIDELGVLYGRVRMIVRLHSKMIGVVDVDLETNAVSASRCAAAIWSALSEQINDHLRDDGLNMVDALDERGLPFAALPRCLGVRAGVLAEAPRASVIICTRNRVDLLPRTLDSLQALEYGAFEVLVIDGSATTETADLVRERFPEVRYSHVGAHGRSFALNRGLSMASGEIVAFTDDDVRVDRYWLAELVSAFADPTVACATGVAFPLELRTRAQMWFEESGGFTDGYRPRIIGLPAPPGSLLPFATGKIGAGVNMAWRRSVLLECGGFDVTMDTLTPVWPLTARHSSSGEDLSAFFDALIRGHRLAFHPDAIVFHEHRRSYEELIRQIYWHGIGLSAHLVRSLLHEPGQIPGFVKQIPRGLAYGFATSSVRNRQKSTAFPQALTRAEWRGIAAGPFAYIRGLPKARRIRAASGSMPGG